MKNATNKYHSPEMTTEQRRTTDGSTAVASPPARGNTPPPRWARRLATLTVLTTVPSALWRIAMALGVPVGADGSYVDEHYGALGWGTAYVIGLSLLLVGLALLTLGLVRPWGERVPRWVPFIGELRIPPLAAVIPAGTGTVAVTLMWVGVFSNLEPIYAQFGIYGAERAVMLLCYLPLLLWGPFLGAVTVSYAKRTGLRQDRPRASSPEPVPPSEGRPIRRSTDGYGAEASYDQGGLVAADRS